MCSAATPHTEVVVVKGPGGLADFWEFAMFSTRIHPPCLVKWKPGMLDVTGSSRRSGARAGVY